ncbi:MAG: hypothetical protein R3F47_01455 [Gammaproteobacteria bacterium]
MGYFDPLYRKDNIIGYTGTLNNNPTVYFVTECRDQTGALKTQAVNGVNQILFWNGHITQAHNDPDNVGREQVSESYSYSIANVGPDKISGFDPKTLLPVQAQETYHQSEVPATGNGYYPTPDGFTDVHVSRNPFIPVGPRDSATLDELAKSIARCPHIKRKYQRF